MKEKKLAFYFSRLLKKSNIIKNKYKKDIKMLPFADIKD